MSIVMVDSVANIAPAGKGTGREFVRTTLLGVVHWTAFLLADLLRSAFCQHHVILQLAPHATRIGNGASELIYAPPPSLVSTVHNHLYISRGCFPLICSALFFYKNVHACGTNAVDVWRSPLLKTRKHVSSRY